jgi:hypothetical protein
MSGSAGPSNPRRSRSPSTDPGIAANDSQHEYLILPEPSHPHHLMTRVQWQDIVTALFADVKNRFTSHDGFVYARHEAGHLRDFVGATRSRVETILVQLSFRMMTLPPSLRPVDFSVDEFLDLVQVHINAVTGEFFRYPSRSFLLKTIHC